SLHTALPSSPRAQKENSPAVFRPPSSGRFCADPALPPKAHARYTLGRYAIRDQVVAGGARATLAEGEIVLDGTALVAVPLDQHEHRRALLEPLGVRLEDPRVAGPDGVLVEVEVDRLHRGAPCELVRAGPGRLGWRGLRRRRWCGGDGRLRR